MIRLALTAASAAAILLSGAQAFAAETLFPSEQIYEESLSALFKLFVVAVVLEQALALVFNWKPFVEVFDGRATKPLISLVFAVALVHHFELDIVAGLLDIYSGADIQGNWGSVLVTAMVLAGGSSAVNTIMKTLGLRTAKDPSAAERPKTTSAWITVSPKVMKAAGTITVIAVGQDNVERSLGTIPDPASGRRSGLLSYFVRNNGRFPSSGGFEIQPGEWAIRVDSQDKTGQKLSSEAWGPYQIAPGAIIDLSPSI